MVEVCLDCAPEFVDQARYVLRLFLEVLGLGYRFCEPTEIDYDRDGFLIYYGDLGHEQKGKKAQISIQAVPVQNPPASLRFMDWQRIRIPVLFRAEVETPGVPLVRFSPTGESAVVFSREQRRICFLGDIISSSFYLLSRREEYSDGPRDSFGRFPGKESYAYRERFLDFPVVDAYIMLLNELLVRLSREFQIPFLKKSLWPQGRRWALCLSHDVDWVRKWTVGGMARFLLQGRQSDSFSNGGFLKRLKTVSQGLFEKKDPYDNLGEILALEDRHQVRSTFFFLPGVANIKHGGRKILGRYPNRFDVRQEAQRILETGCELDLHGSFGSSEDKEQLSREKDMLGGQMGMAPRGIRQHFLKYRFPQTPRIHEELGFDYDTTLGYGDCPGYRCGISYPFGIFDLQDGKELNITEIPLVIMDGGLGVTEGISADEAWSGVERFLRWADRFRGVCTVLWHNTSFCDLDDGGILRRIYEKMLMRSKQLGAWPCACGDLLRWWRWRSQIVIQDEIGKRDGEFEFVLRVPSSGPGTFWLEVVTDDRDHLVVEGCKYHQVLEEGNGPGIIGLQLYDWAGDQIVVRLGSR
jgi:peptidoglycan/xylan/chitin deacetylase (PgdA/CDA1 family)